MTEGGADEREPVWIVLPTYDELENLPLIVPRIHAHLPGAIVLVVDDASPDGTGELADRMAADDARVRVLHRPGKAGLGRAYLDGFAVALAGGADRIVQMDADGSHDPAVLPQLVEALDRADLAIGSRYVPGGGVVDWPFLRRLISRGGSTFARIVLRLPAHDLTGGYKAWRQATLAAIPAAGIHAGGYVFQIEMTYFADRLGARIVELPIVFRDREVGVSKMSRRIVVEALMVVLRLRWDELRGRGPRRSADAARPATGHPTAPPADAPRTSAAVAVPVTPAPPPVATAAGSRGALGDPED